MRPQEIIAKKRDGGRLDESEIGEFINGVIDGSWADYQITALIMAMFIHELDFEEQSLITKAMLYSGEVLEFPDIDRPIADKHSTGGVGDKTSLLIAPLAAACGAAVPMISGRGLGHTGGTLDKFESIPGYTVDLPVERFKQIVSECGFAMSGQTARIAPADKRIYSLRDATATVPTIPLIVASIMSKKLAEGLDALILDVKTGNGAFMQDLESARRLAQEMVRTGDSYGVSTRALITDMGRPLGEYVGNACEVYECLRILRGEGTDGMVRTKELSIELTANLLVLAGLAAAHEEARATVEDALDNGSAYELFRRNVELQGGDTSVCDDPSKILVPDIVRMDVTAHRAGVVANIDTLTIGKVVSSIGGGRTRAEDTIDHAVGLFVHRNLGDEVDEGEPLCSVLCRTEGEAHSASEKLISAYTIAGELPEMPELVLEIVR